MASQPTFDLQVPGRAHSSAMEWFAERGFDAWCMDNEGYGRSDKSRPINCDISNGADDLAAASASIGKKLLVYGISSGALKAALFTQRHPERVARLALDAFVWTGEGSPTLAEACVLRQAAASRQAFFGDAGDFARELPAEKLPERVPSLARVLRAARTGVSRMKPLLFLRRMHAETALALNDPQLRQSFRNSGVQASPLGSEELAAFLRSEYEKWGRVVRDTGAKVN